MFGQIFSNESGLGCAPLVAAAQTKNPVRQALISMTGTFWDTVVICLITGLVLVSCVIKYPHIDALSGNGGELTSMAFAQIPTILGWYYYGECCMIYLFGEKIKILYKIIWVIVVFIGGVGNLPFVWNLADMLNGMMAIPNLAAVLLLSGLIAAEGRKYLPGKHIMDQDETKIPIVGNQKKGVLF